MIQINKVRLVMHLILFGMHCNSACVVSEMTYTVSSGTLNSSIPYHTVTVHAEKYVCHCNSLGGAT